MNELSLPSIAVGGAGNKALMLVEGKGSCYILDRGTSRWDTCASEAILRAYGGKFWKLNEFLCSPLPVERGYTYLKSSLNLDFEPTATQSLSNSIRIREGESPKIEDFKAYSNLSGHVALAPGEDVYAYWAAAQAALLKSRPSYN
jgi:hypothetical protein